MAGRVSPVHGPDAAAIAAARGWAVARFPLLGRTLDTAVTAVDWQPVERVRVACTVRTRRLARMTEVVPRKVLPSGPLPDPAALDPWAADLDRTLAASRAIAICPGCQGTARHTCEACQGQPDRPCPTCQGTGRSVSSRSGKFIRCPTCRGSGRRRCACRDGIVTCTTCLGKTVVAAWLALQETERIETRNAGTPAFVESDAREEIAENVARSSFSADDAQQLRDLPSAETLRFVPDARTERLGAIVVTRETSTKATVHYELAGRTAIVDIESWSGRVTPQPSSEEPFSILRRRLRVAAVIALAASVLLANWFAMRHWYYRDSAATTVLFALALISPFAIAPAVIARARPRTRRMRSALLAAAVPVLLVSGAQGWLIAATGPTMARARALAAAGDHARASSEARAAVELRIHEAPARALHDEEEMALLGEAASPADAWARVARQTFLTPDGRQRAEGVALRKTVDAAGEALRAGDHRRSLRILDGVPASLRAVPLVREAEAAARSASAVPLWRAVTSDASIQERLAACASLDTLGKAVASGDLPASPRQIAAACASVTALEREQARQAQEAVRLAERRQRQAARGEQQRRATAARRRDDAARSSAIAPLLCRDGSLSPTCVCGGPRRGCCSHHGGVAGCSQ